MKRVQMSGACVLILSLAAVAATQPTNADTDAARKAAAGEFAAFVELLSAVDNADVQRDILKGWRDAIRGRRDLVLPSGWSALAGKLSKSPHAEVRALTQSLSLQFRDPGTLKDLRTLVANRKAEKAARVAAMEALAEIHDDRLPRILLPMLAGDDLRAAGFRAMSAYDFPPATPLTLLLLKDLTGEERTAAVSLLTARPKSGIALLKGVAEGGVPRDVLNSYVVRQLAALGNAEVDTLLQQVWGDIRPPKAQTQKLVRKYEKQMTPEYLAGGNAARGRALFDKHCAGCHRLFDHGRQVGPNLTGSQRFNLQYVLENVFDPSATVGRDYRMTIFATEAGRTITGIVKAEAENSITVQTATEDVVLAKSDIVARKNSKVSLMPEGVVEKFTPENLRDLLLYLRASDQVPPAVEE